MKLKTHKSVSKRVRVTKNGKVIKRKNGQGHFNLLGQHQDAYSSCLKWRSVVDQTSLAEQLAKAHQSGFQRFAQTLSAAFGLINYSAFLYPFIIPI